MEWIVAIIVGAFIGWIASIIMGTNAQQGALANIIVGIIGAALGRAIFGSVLGVSSATNAGQFSVGGLLWGIVGAVILIALLRALHVFRRA
jgi:uncharacterized membrane protein YeaQ/YmgE (transglycosylase-associated protein family)